MVTACAASRQLFDRRLQLLRNFNLLLGGSMTHRIYTMSFASVYPHYVAKAERKGRSRAEVDEIIRWLTGYTQQQLEAVLEDGTDFENFFADAPRVNPSRA